MRPCQKGFSTTLASWVAIARRDLEASLRDPLPNVLAGVTVAIVALPLALAFGLIAFGPVYGPAAGLWSAIIAGFVASALGGTPYAITGPTGVLAVFTAGLVLDHGGFGSSDAIMFGFFAVVLSGLFQIAFGLLRMGRVIEFIPYPVITGFMNGIAVIIFVSGLEEVLAPGDGGLAGGLWPALAGFAAAEAPPVVYAAAAVALASLLLTSTWSRLARRLPPGRAQDVLRRLPGSLVALLLLTVVAAALPALAGIRHLSPLPPGLPAFALDLGFLARHPDWTRDLLLGALGLALISSMDTLLTSVIADSVVGKRHASDRELVAQGLGNALAGSFGANQACGAAVRTMVNIRNGGRTRLSGVTHALVLAVLVLAGGGLATLVPLAVLSGILLTTAIGMVEWRAILQAHRAPWSDTAVMLVTTMVTVWAGLIEAVVVGVVLAALLFVKRMTELTDFVGEPEFTGGERRGLEGLERDVVVYEVRGPLFFGAAARFARAFERSDLASFRVVLLRMNSVTAIDESGLRSLEMMVDRIHRHGQTLVLSRVAPEVLARLERFGLLARIGPENVAPDLAEAVRRARVLVGGPSGSPGAGSTPSPQTI